MRHALTPLILLLAVLPLVSSGCYIRVGLDPSNDDDDSSPSDDDDTTEADDDDVTDPPDDDDATDPPDDDDATGTPFSIDEIDPNDGSTDGGYTAEIFYEGDLGGAEEDEIEVYFGTTLTEVLAVTDTKLLVTVPPGCVPGEIDVKVELPDGQDDDVEFEFER